MPSHVRKDTRLSPFFCTASDEKLGGGVVSSGGAPTPAGTSVFTKHNWDMGMGYMWLNGWGIYHLMGGAFFGGGGGLRKRGYTVCTVV